MNNRLIKFGGLCLVLAGVILSAACSKPSNTKDAGKPKHITFVTPLIAHESWLLAKEGFDQAAKDIGFEAEWVGPANQDVNEMIKYLEIAIAQNVTGIITQGQNPEAMVEVLQKAADAGIPVVVCDSTIEDAPQLAYIGFDIKKASRLAAEEITGQLGNNTKAEVLYLTTAIDYSAATSAYNYFCEFMDTLAPQGYTVQQLETKGDRLTAMEVAEAALLANPGINAIFCIDGIAAPACAQVLEEMGRRNVVVIGIDDTPEQLDLIRAGKIHAVTYGSFFKQAYQGCLWIMDYINTGAKPRYKYNDVGTMLITKANVDTYAKDTNDPSKWTSYEPLSYIDE